MAGAALVDAAQAARLLSVPASWVLAEARADRIPHVRLGRYVRFSAEELEDWWRARIRGPWRARGVDSHIAHRNTRDSTRQLDNVAQDTRQVSEGGD